MKASLSHYLRCPSCQAELTIDAKQVQNDMIWSGTLTCKHGHCFMIDNGIPQMFSPELPGYTAKMGEAAGWVRLAQDRGWYEPLPEIDLALPHVVEKLGWRPADASGWLGTEYSLAHLFKHVVRPGMRVLEIGAAKAWAGRFFVEAGCEYTACDIVADPKIGLARSYFFMEQAHCHYELVATDAEYLPFADNTFDLVFAIAALHHALDLPQMLKSIARVTKRGGTVAGLAEGVRSFRANPNAAQQADEKTYGINEHVYSLRDYFNAFLSNGLWVTRLYRAIGHEWFLTESRKKRVDRWAQIPYWGDWFVALDILGFTHEYDGVSIYGKKLY